MKHAIARLLESLVRCRNRRKRKRGRDLYLYPYSCDYVCGPTAYRTGERPPRGEDSALVRPYLVAHETRMAEERRRRARRRTLWISVREADGTRFIRGAEVTA
ncbi:hypothetical protein P8A22_25575 [Streptomyces laculatispora]|uniref:Uncharacterized protein n=1 Tax=Streptomyces laculatispora TaxID=887464 RepID=A0ABY9IBK8_9ACTN|nr:hypothetical protein [Streptomyces laculatispora]WLQ43006.1 hypothetical protein P8A22_25575 [Streptomyces laculatispora]